MQLKHLAFALSIISAPFLSLTTAQAGKVRVTIQLNSVMCGNTEDVQGADEFYVVGAFTDGTKDNSRGSLIGPISINDGQKKAFQGTVFDAVVDSDAKIRGGMKAFDEDFGKDWSKKPAWIEKIKDGIVQGLQKSDNPKAVAAGTVLDLGYKVFNFFANADKDDELGSDDFTFAASGPALENKSWDFYEEGLGYSTWNYSVYYTIKRQAVSSEAATSSAPKMPIGGPAVALDTSGRIHVFGRGQDRHIWENVWNGSSWSGNKRIENGTFTSAPTAIAAPDGAIHLFAAGDDRNIWHAYLLNGGQWSGWTSEFGPGSFSSAPAATIGADGTLFVFARGDDRYMWYNFWNGSAWSGNKRIENGTFTSSPTSVTTPDGVVHVFALGDDRNIWHAFFRNGAWSGWVSDLGAGSFSSGPTIVLSTDGKLHLIARGDDRYYWVNTWTGSNWTGNKRIENGSFTSAPTAVATPDGSVHVFGFGDDRNLWHAIYNGSSWSGWSSELGPGVFLP
jgi:hypothetical protein